MIGSLFLSRLPVWITLSQCIVAQTDLSIPSSNDDESSSHLAQLSTHYNISQIETPNFSVGSRDDNFEILSSIRDLTFIQYTGQQNFTHVSSNRENNDLIYTSNNTFIRLVQDSNASITDIVPFQNNGFILSGEGSFNYNNKIYNLDNQLIYNFSDFSLRQLYSQPLNYVNSILQDDNLIYFGGNFSLDNDMTNSAAIWNGTSGSNSTLPFSGFGDNSHVNSIIKLNDDNILFTGKFNTLDNTIYLNRASESNGSYPYNPLVPLEYATWETTSGNVSSDSIICPNQSPESQDGWTASGINNQLTCKIPFDVTPSKIRVFNSNDENNAISLFRILTYPASSIMNMTYIDPLTGELTSCDAFCPLYSTSVLESSFDNSTSTSKSRFINNNKTSIEWTSQYQEFAFVNPVSVSSLEIMTLSSFGNVDVSLKGFQLFQSSYSVFANNTLNVPPCNPDSDDITVSSILSNNNWSSNNSNYYLSVDYIPNSKSPSPYVKFDVDIQNRGTYSVDVFTPGCSDDNTCNSRGIVNVTLIDSITNDILTTTLIYQNNDQIKYDNIYQGEINNPCQVILRYSSGLFSSNTMTTVVADRIDVNIMSLELDSSNQDTVQLNGILQYQLSNFTNNKNHLPIGMTDLNQFASTTLSSSSQEYNDVTATLYDNTTLLLSNLQNTLYVLDLNSDLQIDSVSQLNTTTDILTHHSFSEGIILLTEGSDEIYVYNGTLNSFLTVNNTIINSVSNITLWDTEFLVFNNDLVYNVSSQQFLTDSTASFNISLQTSARNNVDDTLFFGSISMVDYAFNDKAVSINSQNNSINTFPQKSDVLPYRAVYLNESTSAYFYETNESTRIQFNNDISNSLTWNNTVSTSLYDDNNTQLITGQSGSSKSTAVLSVLDLTTLKFLKNSQLTENDQINGLLNFPLNKSVLVGGTFQIKNTGCSNLCLYNYDDDKWSSFMNNSIDLNINDLSLFKEDTVVILGSNSSDSKELATFNMTSNDLTFLSSDDKITGFIATEDSIIGWNDSALLFFDNELSITLTVPVNSGNNETDNNVTPSINSVEAISVQGDQDDGLLLFGNMYDSRVGAVQAMVYSQGKLTPYMFISEQESNSTSTGLRSFVNKDISSFMVSQFPLPNANETVESTSTVSYRPSSTSTTTSSHSSKTPSKQSKAKIRRGFIVLIGLALSLATVTVLGFVGVLLAYMFKGSSSGNYQSINPIIDENEMIDTLPPEKIMNLM